MPSSSMVATGEVHIRPTAACRGGLCREGAACVRGGRNSTASCGTCRPCPWMGSRSDLHMNAGVMLDLPHVARNQRGLDRTVSDRTPVHGGLQVPAGQPAIQALYKSVMDAVPDQAGDVSDASTSAATRSCRICPGWRKRTRRSAGARSGSGSTGPLLLRSQLRAMIKAGAGRELAHHVPDGGDGRRNSWPPRRSLCVNRIGCLGHGHDDAERPSSLASWWRCRRCCGSSMRSPRLPTSCRWDRMISRQYLFRGRPGQQAGRHAVRYAFGPHASCFGGRWPRLGAASRASP